MDDENVKDKIKDAKKHGWIETSMFFEVMAINEEVSRDMLKTHIEKLKGAPNSLVSDVKFSDVRRVEKPPIMNIEFAWSQICELKFYVRDLDTLISTVYLYGPSSIEIIGPDKILLKAEEMQRIVNAISGLVHQYAQAGIGGIVIAPNK